VKRKIFLYGRLRDAGFGASIAIDLPARADARAALAALRTALGAKANLLQGCALATDKDVLAPGARLPPRGVLAALPPVFGG